MLPWPMTQAWGIDQQYLYTDFQQKFTEWFTGNNNKVKIKVSLSQKSSQFTAEYSIYFDAYSQVFLYWGFKMFLGTI